MTVKWPWQKPNIPDRLYKFYTPARTEVFETFRVRFSQLAALNDPFEFLVSAKQGDLRKGATRLAGRQTNLLNLIGVAASASLRSVRKNAKFATLAWPLQFLILAIVTPIAIGIVLLLSPFIGRQMRAIMIAAADEIENILFTRVREGLVLVFSCSETWESVPMWAHYASNHTGFVLGIDPKRAFIDGSERAKTPFIYPRKVRYLRREPKVSPNLDIGDFICAKMDHWAYEQEWRFIGVPDEAASRGTFVDGQELLLFDLSSDSISEVIFGAKCSPSTVTNILRLLAKSGKIPDLYQVRQRVGYGFERVRIESVSDLNFEQAIPSPVPTLHDQPFHHLNDAFENFTRDAERGRMTRWFLHKAPAK